MSKIRKTTYINYLIKESGRFINWYARNLGYRVSQSVSSMNMVASGRRIPSAKKRVELANLLNVKVNDLWYLCNDTGKIKPVLLPYKGKKYEKDDGASN